MALAWLATGCASRQQKHPPIWEPGQAPLERLSEGAGEGPAWHPTGRLFFSGHQSILAWNPDEGTQTYREGAGTNGLLFDHQGRLIACEPSQRRVTRQDQMGRIEVLTSTFEGAPYNSPNDLSLDSKGRIYFSDPRYGDRSSMAILDHQGKPVEGVYCIHPDGQVTRVITHEVDRPNGVLVSSDDRYLYVADNHNNTPNGARKLWRFLLRADGSADLSSQTLIFDWKTSRGPDGMVQDTKGRLYVAAGLNRDRSPVETVLPFPAGIYVFSPEGTFLDHLPIPNDEVTNCTFGGEDLKTLFITAGGHLWSIRTSTPGDLPWPKPERQSKNR